MPLPVSFLLLIVGFVLLMKGADIFVDGKKIKTVNGYDKDGWNNARIVLAINEEAKKVHTIEIRMAKGNRKKDFTVLAMGYH